MHTDGTYFVINAFKFKILFVLLLKRLFQVLQISNPILFFTDQNIEQCDMCNKNNETCFQTMYRSVKDSAGDSMLPIFYRCEKKLEKPTEDEEDKGDTDKSFKEEEIVEEHDDTENVVLGNIIPNGEQFKKNYLK